ncbi:UNVERIFIED_CONTAM: Differentially expressed in FDCP 8 [Sesamum radiatum]|uniref:Differentially expressed in FDCP 8 n=1 Tax=Sesamum radiatum TaxID=300843 RepID=A0AAW2PK87_SESRA
MINGEGAEEKQASAVASPCDPPGDQESDGGDDLSHYSSCGGESEYERYCSASSVMGTPSFRSSSFQDSDFGSFKSFKLGGESTSFKHLGAERVLSCYQESKCGSGSSGGDEFDCDKDNGMLNLNGRMESFALSNVDLRGNFDVDGNWGTEVVIENGKKGNSEETARVSAEFGEFGKEYCYRSGETGCDKGEGLEIDGGEDGNLLDEGEASSRYEHSEGEESMFGCGSDDDRKIDIYYRKNAHLFHGEESGRKENQLVMNSTVAFGSNDWDDFDQESRGTPIMVWDEIQGGRQTSVQSGISSLSFAAANPVTYPNMILEERQDEVRSTHAAPDQFPAGVQLVESNMNASSTNTNLLNLDSRFQDVKGVLVSGNQVSDMDELSDYLGLSPGYNIFQTNKDPPAKEALANEEVEIGETESVLENQDPATSEVRAIRHDIVLENWDLEETKLDPLSECAVNNQNLLPTKSKEVREAKLSEDNSSSEMSSFADTTTSTTMKKNFSFAFDQIENHFVPAKSRGFELNDFYDEIVNDMEDILLDSGESLGSRFAHGGRIHQTQFPQPLRDGGSTASTSGTDYACNWSQQPLKIDRIEVVGARQKKGDVSFSERLVGVQKYTVYKIRVWSGEDHWEVERRYRDFSTLYYRLKKLFADHGWILPSPWSSVERESRKLFGNASPSVIADRSVLIQECLQSVIHAKFSSGSLNPLIGFLSPSEGVPDSPASDSSASPSPFFNRSTQMENCSTLGQTVSLVVQIRPLKSMKQMLDSQHHKCAGCHRNFDDGRTRLQEFAQTLGWGKPRLCEYSGQLFCSLCHNNDTAVLPARVLHYWDFTQYPVSQLAKSYLDSINDQPMLCVSAVNPLLFSKVPTLQHVANIRNRIRAMLPYVRCPFRRSVYKGLGSRRYLLDSNDFFALRDLINLSKGVFSGMGLAGNCSGGNAVDMVFAMAGVIVGLDCGPADGDNGSLSGSYGIVVPFKCMVEVGAFRDWSLFCLLTRALPVMVESVSRKVEEHITEQCLLCYDVGVPCSARQDCSNPLSLIFPFQEGEVEKCRSCELVFHKNCIKKIASCPCGARFKLEEMKQSADGVTRSANSNLNLLGGMAESSTGLLTGLFAKVIPGRSQIPRKQDTKGVDNVILMGALPNASL